MTVADGSQVRLADISETVIGTIPATPAFQTMRYVSSDIRVTKQTDTPDEIRADGNVASIVDVGRNVQGSINTFLSYSTYDTWLERLLRSSWSSDVLKNGVALKAGSLEQTYPQGGASSFIRFRGCRWNTLDMQMTAKQPISANWGIMGLGSPAPTQAIITGTTYLDPTTTPVINAGLNVANLALTGITNSPKIRQLSIKIDNGLYENDVVGAYEPDSIGLGKFIVTGSFDAYFENLDTYNAILSHADVGLAFTAGNDSGSKYTFAFPKMKLLDGGPQVPGNGKAVMITVPFQAYYDATSAASMSITRAVV